MNRIDAILGLAIICLMCACSRKKFVTTLLSKNIDRVDTASVIKYYDHGSGFFYLLTFYKTIQKNPGEDFTFEGVSTYKGSQESEDNVEGDTTVIQYLALYFFSNGGVVYHTKYKIAPHEKYVPLELDSFEDLYRKDQLRKRGDKTEFMRYQPLMQGYQSKKINAQKVVEPSKKEDTKTPKDSLYAAKNRQLFSQAVQEKPDSVRTGPISRPFSREVARSEPADSTLIKLYLERRGGGRKSSIFLLGKHLPNRSGQKEAILIEQIFYHPEVRSAGGRFIPALLSEVFDLGIVNETDKQFKPLFWFRLEKKEDFKKNLPNKKR